jgi:hypothetical protein
MHFARIIMLVGSLLTTQSLPEEPLRATSIARESEQFARFVERYARMVNVHVSKPTPNQAIGYAIEGLFENQRTPVPPAIGERLAALPQADQAESLSLLRDVYPHVCDPNGVEETFAAAVDAISRKLEPGAKVVDVRGRYIRRADVRSFSFGEGRPSGVGLVLEVDPETKMLRVVTPIYKSPAHKAGIGAGDLVTHLRILNDAEGNPLAEPKLVSTQGMTPKEAEALILGRWGTPIGLVIGWPKTKK